MVAFAPQHWLFDRIAAPDIQHRVVALTLDAMV